MEANRHKLRKILFDCWNQAKQKADDQSSLRDYIDWTIENEDKILALVKPRPLTKNKQFDKSCPHSNEPILVNGHYECPDCGKYGEDC